MKDERGRLKAFLTFWTEHNKEDSEKFRKWAEKANIPEDESIYNSILQTTREMEEADERLSHLLIEL
ncbi:MAG: hypothetical protein COW04_13330 [Deltaproteobacteria bacterium CG12_big_fil_rev_8_21_14_0_65_43_10]|nr:MAG: hypothetical protein AUK23_11525 [Deltaproteobacteria bacterium CG2_30_43_15]PIQ44368.1 MAG: hypothetical protein COW04_13330 [Deltaproteobacteria bacterium CG12_big_fil_rev_8_21_14_0_65_43_10]PIU86823.1 MAG: hypothetical protein COS67_00440 [Deltaproteobacteria bacterium CG06_land_8_20_14_3_00_44_19]PIX26593.1 MAG: hypothetical protein COZ68_00790 [Deltaproteobacteria bacterium CG_4_8_14_3_um_filter_43_13]PIZ21088.1 MAG: hypothetical protein COY50_01285 [Deltaproteobacteria bacterium C